MKTSNKKYHCIDQCIYSIKCKESSRNIPCLHFQARDEGKEKALQKETESLKKIIERMN